MEQLLHYVWKHKIFLHSQLTTTDGRTVEVINPGLPNTNAGPDFSNAKIKIDGVLWVGNIEIHQRTSDWFRHHHDTDPAYDNIILHVVEEADMPLVYPNGQSIPQLQITVPSFVSTNYEQLISQDHTPRCAKVAGTLPLFTIHNWMTSLTLQRFEYRNQQILKRRQSLDLNWEDTLFTTIARNFGFGINGDAFEAWAHSIPMNAVAKHRDNLFQIEAIFFGQAGLLNDEMTPKNVNSSKDAKVNKVDDHQQNEDNNYYERLAKEYRYLRQKFSLTPIPTKLWRFLRLRPQNFPHIRIAQLAMLYYEQKVTLSHIINTTSTDDIAEIFRSRVSDYWRTHYTFTSSHSRATDKSLSKNSINLLVINTIAPFLFAYGKYKSDEDLCDRAFNLWQSMPPENNHIIRDWAAAGVACENSADSQALIHLTHNYCDRHDCLRCKFGYEYIKHTPDFLCEDETQE